MTLECKCKCGTVLAVPITAQQLVGGMLGLPANILFPECRREEVIFLETGDCPKCQEKAWDKIRRIAKWN